VMDQATREAYRVLSSVGLNVAETWIMSGEPVTDVQRVRRLLITGSRTWTDQQAIKDALRPWWFGGSTILVHGACLRGADAIADRIWAGAGGSTDPHPAAWEHCVAQCPEGHRKHSRHGEYCPTAGHRRNAEMIKLGVDQAIAFLATGSSPGTRGMIGLINKARIPLTIIKGR
jgi:hypothetical protein